MLAHTLLWLLPMTTALIVLPNDQRVLQSPISTFDIDCIRFDPEWDSRNTNDKRRMDRIKTGFKEAMQLAWAASIEAGKKDRTIFNRYFGNGSLGKKPANQTIVKNIFDNIHGFNLTTGNDILKKISFRKTPEPDADDDGCAKRGALAYISRIFDDRLGWRAYIVFCNKFWELPDFSPKRCASLGPKTSFDMDTFGRGLLHEILHFPTVAEKAGWDTLEDVTNGKHTCSYYGPQRVQDLAKNDPDKAVENSDSFAWFAAEARWTEVCQQRFGKAKPEGTACT